MDYTARKPVCATTISDQPANLCSHIKAFGILSILKLIVQFTTDGFNHTVQIYLQWQVNTEDRFSDRALTTIHPFIFYESILDTQKKR